MEFNTLGLNSSYLISKLFPDVDEQDLSVLFSLDEEKTSEIVSLKTFYDGVNTEAILPNYYTKSFLGWDYNYEVDDFTYLVEDYAKI